MKVNTIVILVTAEITSFYDLKIAELEAEAEAEAEADAKAVSRGWDSV